MKYCLTDTEGFLLDTIFDSVCHEKSRKKVRDTVLRALSSLMLDGLVTKKLAEDITDNIMRRGKDHNGVGIVRDELKMQCVEAMNKIREEYRKGSTKVVEITDLPTEKALKIVSNFIGGLRCCMFMDSITKEDVKRNLDDFDVDLLTHSDMTEQEAKDFMLYIMKFEMPF